jgi:branched-chain amino acid transport system substrate-binding protein
MGGRRLAVVGGVLAVLLAGCGGTSDTGGGAAPPPKVTLKGEPITVGLTYTDSGAYPQPDFPAGAQATVRHINEDLGGVDGRPLKLAICPMDGSPEGNTRCANLLLAKNPIAVVNAEDRGSDAALPIYQKAKVPYVSYSATGAQMTVNPSAITLGGGIPLVLGAWAKFLVQDLGAKRVGFVYPEVVPAEAIKMFFGHAAEQLGAQDELVPYSPKAPDLAAPITAADGLHLDAMAVAFTDASACVQGIRSIEQLGVDAKVTHLLCNEDKILDQVGSAADGMYFLTQTYVGSGIDDAPDLVTYIRYMKKFAPDQDPLGDARYAGMSLMTLYSVLEKSADDLTAENVLKTFKSAPGHLFLGRNYECGTLKPFPSLCVDATRFVQIENGKRVPASDWLGAADLLTK